MIEKANFFDFHEFIFYQIEENHICTQFTENMRKLNFKLSLLFILSRLFLKSLKIELKDVTH
jgi:hypothetical protein